MARNKHWHNIENWSWIQVLLVENLLYDFIQEEADRSNILSASDPQMAAWSGNEIRITFPQVYLMLNFIKQNQNRCFLISIYWKFPQGWMNSNILIKVTKVPGIEPQWHHEHYSANETIVLEKSITFFSLSDLSEEKISHKRYFESITIRVQRLS